MCTKQLASFPGCNANKPGNADTQALAMALIGYLPWTAQNSVTAISGPTSKPNEVALQSYLPWF